MIAQTFTKEEFNSSKECPQCNGRLIFRITESSEELHGICNRCKINIYFHIYLINGIRKLFASSKSIRNLSTALK